MASNPVKREYNFSDARLVQLCDDIMGSVTRDLDDFGNFAVTQATLDALETKRNDFDDMQTDGELLGEISIATETKNAKRDELMGILKMGRAMAENQWGINSAYYRQFGFDGMLHLPDDKLLRLSRKVHRVATSRLSILAAQGLDQTKLDQLEALRQQFDDLVDAKEEAIETRDIKTQQRREAGNVIYREIIRLANFGKVLFEQKDEARYNDYIIYNTSTAESPAEPDTTLEVAVTDSINNQPVAGAAVHIVELDLTIETDADGKVLFDALQPGALTIQVFEPDYQLLEATTDVGEGIANTLAIALAPE